MGRGQRRPLGVEHPMLSASLGVSLVGTGDTGLLVLRLPQMPATVCAGAGDPEAGPWAPQLMSSAVMGDACPLTLLGPLWAPVVSV